MIIGVVVLCVQAQTITSVHLGNALAIGWFDEKTVYNKTALLSPHTSAFPAIAEILMPVLIGLPYCTCDIHLYLLS